MTKKIYVVDDEKGIRELLKRVYEIHGYEVLTVDSAESALEMISKSVPDAVVSDTDLLGKMKGYDLCKTVRGDDATRNVKIIGTSGNLTDGYEQRWIEAGANAYFEKPFKSIIDLLNKTKELLGE